MENNSIIKTKFQLIPGIILTAFIILFIALKFSDYPDPDIAQRLWSAFEWIFALLAVVFVFISLVVLVIKIIKKNNDYTLLKKTGLMLLELIILFFMLLGTQGFIKSFFHISQAQEEARIHKLNDLKIGEGVSQADVNDMKLFFKDGALSEIYAEMRQGKIGIPKGDPSKRSKNLLKIEKLDKNCHFIGEESWSFENCAEGDLYVVYGWDACRPQLLDCLGENYYESYLIRNVKGEYKIIEAFP